MTSNVLAEAKSEVPFSTFLLKKKEVPISMAIGKCETCAPVFSRTLAHGNSKYEIIQKNRERMQAEKSEYGKKEQIVKKSPDDPTLARACHPPGVATPQSSE